MPRLMQKTQIIRSRNSFWTILALCHLQGHCKVGAQGSCVFTVLQSVRMIQMVRAWWCVLFRCYYWLSNFNTLLFAGSLLNVVRSFNNFHFFKLLNCVRIHYGSATFGFVVAMLSFVLCVCCLFQFFFEKKNKEIIV